MGRGVVWVRKEARKQHLEMWLGLLGFFTFGVFVAATYVVYRAWRKAG